MKIKQLLQELFNWQWEISGYQKTAFLIEERLDVIQQNNNSAPTETRMKIKNLQLRFIDEEKELDNLEKVLVNQKQILRSFNESPEWLKEVEVEQQQLRNRLSKEKTVFLSLKTEYNCVLYQMLLKIAS